jgi:hypothetical protein
MRLMKCTLEIMMNVLLNEEGKNPFLPQCCQVKGIRSGRTPPRRYPAVLPFEKKGRINNSLRERKYLFIVNNKTCYHLTLT